MKHYYFSSELDRAIAFCVDFDKKTSIELVIDHDILKVYKSNCTNPNEIAASILKDGFIPIDEDKFTDIFKSIFDSICCQ